MISVASVFCDHLVLQQGRQGPIWGRASPGERIQVRFADQSVTTEADAAGHWHARLPALQASETPRDMEIAGSERLTIRNVTVGEVWVLAGQSNMRLPLSNTAHAAEVLRDADHPWLRMYKAPWQEADAPCQDLDARWSVCSADTVLTFSGVGFFFAQELRRALGIPVGLLDLAMGGTRIETWMPAAAYDLIPELKGLADAPVPAEATHQLRSRFFNGMVHPVIPYATAGWLWYQGESNGEDGDRYRHKLRGLVAAWRAAWGQGELPFYYVQLANWKDPSDEPAGGDGWAGVREAQRRAMRDIARCGMAVAIDLGDSRDIHPRNKRDVGLRLARWALADTYGRSGIVPCGPLYRGHERRGQGLVVRFDHVGSGLMAAAKPTLGPVEATPDAPLSGFALAGIDRCFHHALAGIDGETVVVSSAAVPEAAAVRYAYRMNPVGCNLYNREGLPACPFRSDDW